MKIISFSLWGNNPKYTIGAIKNADLARTIYPDWICRFYCFNTVPLEIINQLKSKNNAEIKLIETEGNNLGMFNRFEPAEEPGVDAMISRDTDSRLSLREKYAVDEWLNFGKDFHIMRDHPVQHAIPILGGMWGVLGNKIKNLSNLIKDSQSINKKGQDQLFLARYIYPKIKNNELSCLVHDPFYENFNFPKLCKRGKDNNNVFFIGQSFDENDNSDFTEAEIPHFLGK